MQIEYKKGLAKKLAGVKEEVDLKQKAVDFMGRVFRTNPYQEN
jgi:hypothetical protein